MTHAAAVSQRSGRPFVYVAALFFVLLCLMPPTGKLSDNEEDYFALAARAVSHVRPSPDTAIFDASPHRFVNEFALGHLIAAAGFETAQMTARSVAALAYAIALCWLFRCLGLSALDAVLVVVVFAMMGQTLFANEWLFGDYEAKIPAYALVIAGLASSVSRRSSMLSALLFAAATYFHFLVGIFWFLAAMALRLTEDRREGRRVLTATALFVLAVAPLLALIASSRIGDGTVAAPDMPSPDVIYSIIRAPHHTSPFLSWDNFVGQWLPGLLLAGAMLATTVVVTQSETSQRLRPVAQWLGGLLIYLFFAFAAAYLDRRTGALGKFYLFRPASLLLLLWLALATAFLNSLETKQSSLIKALALALLLPNFLLGAANRVTGERAGRAAHAEETALLAGYLAPRSSPQDVVLIDPDIEFSFLDFERMIGRPTLVAWKFMPTNDREIVEWYRRIGFRKALFDSGCPARPPYRVDYLLTTPEHGATLAKTCGAVVWANSRLALLRRGG